LHRNRAGYGGFAKPGVEIVVLQGSSQEPAIIEAARSYGPYGWVFVDGDHDYTMVKEDWDNYRPMVAAGGVLVFHDIAGDDVEVGPRELFAEIKAEGYKTGEYVHGGPGWGGFGIVYL